MGVLFKRPERIMRLLEASYRRNGSRMVALLDKSTREIMSGNYDAAEQFIAKGLTVCKNTPSLFNQAMAQCLFCNLCAIYYFRGNYAEALDLAIRVYERDQGSINALTVIVCSQARLGDLQGAIEAYRLLDKKARNEQQLFCQAEIEAAKGNFSQALGHLHKLTRLRYFYTIHVGQMELEKRLEEWSKASSQAG
jgi:tetratricopeptide (TPR) repeat protein